MRKRKSRKQLFERGRLFRGARLIFGRRASDGFTLIELMVVVLVLAVLVSIAVAVYIDSRKTAADNTRLANAKVLQEVLMRYRFDTGNFPANTDNDYGGWDGDRDGMFIRPLSQNHYLKKDIKDPKDPTGTLYNSSGNWHYYRYGPGSYGADPAKGYYCVFGIRDMEKSGRPHPLSPGWSTPGRNWQNEFDWVDGFYQYP